METESAQPLGGQKDAMLGRTIGSYRIVRKIAQGGMGAVYEAVHSTLGRRAAVKVMLSQLLSNAESAARFFTEAKAVSMVTHPCLVTIYEHGTAEGPGGPQAYIAMEFIEGESLRARTEKDYLGGSAIGLMKQLASALAATHKKRILHRDLKPDNIMLVRDDTLPGGVRAKILDFGIAKFLPDGEEGEPAAPAPDGIRRSVKTRTGALIGTPTYMSPEQCRASATIDDKTDVYSLGIIFYELLYGEPPFNSESAGEMYAMHLFAPPPELGKRVPGINPQLAALVLRMIDKKPTERPSMEELITQLSALPGSGLSDGPAASRPSVKAEAEDDGSTSSVMRRHIIASEGIGAALNRGSAQKTTGAASSGEKVVLPRPPAAVSSRVRALGIGVLVLLGVAGALFAGLRRPPPRPTPATPSPVVVSPELPRPQPQPAPQPAQPAQPAPQVPTVGPGPAHTAPGPTAPTKPPPNRKDKTGRKTPHGSKPPQYQIDLWK